MAPDSTVETFTAVRLQIDSWRWAGVPFYIRAGKCLPVTATEVLVELKRPPVMLFPIRPSPAPTASVSGSARTWCSPSVPAPSCRAKRCGKRTWS